MYLAILIVLVMIFIYFVDKKERKHDKKQKKDNKPKQENTLKLYDPDLIYKSNFNLVKNDPDLKLFY